MLFKCSLRPTSLYSNLRRPPLPHHIRELHLPSRPLGMPVLRVSYGRLRVVLTRAGLVCERCESERGELGQGHPDRGERRGGGLVVVQLRLGESGIASNVFVS